MVDTVRTQAYLLNSVFQDGQAANSINEQDMRDFVVSIPANAGPAWAYYEDSTYTMGSPRAISSGVRTKYTNDAAATATDETQAPYSFWDNSTNKVISTQDFACFIMRLNFKAQYASGTNVGMELELDIGGSIGVFASRTETFLKTASTPQSFSWSVLLFTKSTYVANGAEIYITPNANIDIWSTNLLITRLYNPQT